MIELFDHQKKAISEMKNGCILNGDVGTGKSLTSLAYYICKVCDGSLDKLPKNWVKMVIITTAKKRDSGDWSEECAKIGIPSSEVEINSWNNIKKYLKYYDCFFIFDEQRASGAGEWAKSFIKIARKNKFILLSATPGDNWLDYIPIFVANGFYRNRTEFLRCHVVFSPFTTYPKVERYMDTYRLMQLRNDITVIMSFEKEAISHHIDIFVEYDKEKYDEITQGKPYKDAEGKIRRVKWDPYKDEPIQQESVEYYLARRVSNEGPQRVEECLKLIEKHQKVIIFYSFNYELDILRSMCEKNGLVWAELNGKKHEEVPEEGEKWAYLVQYFAGAEAWECISCDTIIFYSQDTSYKRQTQASGRINRLNTPFSDLYFYHLKSKSWVDTSISRSLSQKKDFNLADYQREKGAKIDIFGGMVYD